MREGQWPTGTVTFLMTDVVGSSSLAEEDPARYLELLARHDDLAHRAVEGEGGVVVKHRGEGDSIFAAFGSAEAGARAAQALVSGSWSELGLELRAALHCGEATLAQGDYRGDAVNRCGRLRGLAGARQVLLSGSVAALLASVSAQPLGAVRLRGLVRPVELFVLAGEGLVVGSAQIGSRRGNLATPSGRLYGREEEIAAVGRAFERRRFVELVGPGGAGKTRLASEFGARGEGFPGGVWFVDLTRTEAAPIEPTILNELGLLAPGERDAASVVAEALEAGVSGVGGASLLILDNCEHVAEAVAGFVRRLGPLAPSLRVLFTTLEHLAVAGLATVKVGPLASAEAAGAMLRDLAEAKAIPVNGSDAEVAALCGDLDGLPLAIELVVPRLRTLSVAGVRGRLGGWLGRGGGETGVEGRQSSLGALVAYSLGRLSPEERDLLESLARFAGGFTLGHAEAACGCDPEDAEETLGSLLEKSMVSPDEQGADAGGEPRFRLLSAVRAGVLAGTADPEGRGGAFVAWASAWAEAGVAAGAPFAAIREEVANLEAAFDDALELGDVTSAARIAWGLRKPYLADFNARAGRRLYDALSSRFHELEDEERADALNSLGIFRLWQRAFPEARTAFEAARAHHERTGNRERMLAAGLNLAIVHDGEGDPSACAAAAAPVVIGFEAAGNAWLAARARLTLALGLFRAGREAEAADAFSAVGALVSGEDQATLGDAYHSALAIEYLVSGREGAAREALMRMSGTAPDAENEFGVALLGAARLLQSDQPELARRCLGCGEAMLALRGLSPHAHVTEIVRRLKEGGLEPRIEEPSSFRDLWGEVERMLHNPVVSGDGSSSVSVERESGPAPRRFS